MVIIKLMVIMKLFNFYRAFDLVGIALKSRFIINDSYDK